MVTVQTEPDGIGLVTAGVATVGLTDPDVVGPLVSVHV